ncbi:carbohydrate kinase, putative, partial [Hepatocystis sp. ex Piliocolobus tephrosceles]
MHRISINNSRTVFFLKEYTHLTPLFYSYPFGELRNRLYIHISKNMEEFPIQSVEFANVQLNEKISNKCLYSVRSSIIHKLSTSDYKGCSGKICIIGGSNVYCGAPFFASMSALKLGVDLCFVLTTKECSVPLKCYSPDLIIYPYLYTDNFNIDNVNSSDLGKCVDYLSKKIDCCVIGPGLGVVNTITQTCLTYIIKKFIQHNIFLIFDADIIQFIITNKNLLNIVKVYENCIFTPNINEFKISISILLNEENITFDKLKINNIIIYAHKLMQQFNGPKFLIKGFYDVYISKHYYFLSFINNQSLKRVGGIGDIL